MVLNRKGRNNQDGSFDWENALIDAGIMAGLTFFTALGGTAVVGIPTKEGIIAAGIAAATEFFLILAIKRGLRERK